MFRRKHQIYCILIIIINALYICFDIFSIKTGNQVIQLKGELYISSQFKTFLIINISNLLMFFSSFIMILNLIFNKNNKIQKILFLINIIVVLIAFIFLLFLLIYIKKIGFQYEIHFNFFIPLFNIMFTIFAIKYANDEKKLLKSFNRIR